MDTKLQPLLQASATLLLALYCASASAAGPVSPLDRIGILDARTPTAASVVWPGSRLHKHAEFVDLTTRQAPRVACCLTLNSTRVQTEILRLDESEQALPVLAVQADARPRLRQGLIGLAMAGRGARVKRLTAQQLELRWTGKPSVTVQHCLSAEGLHIRMHAANRPAQVQHFYVPLGAESESEPAMRCQ